MGGSSNALDVSTPTQDLKYMLTSNVNVSNFVSVKLSDRSNYPIWKAQMTCLIQSQELLHIIEADEGSDADSMNKKYDNLVKGWIFGSMNEKVLKYLVHFNSAHELWRMLESVFSSLISDIEGGSSNKLDVNAIRDALNMMLYNAKVTNYISESSNNRYATPIDPIGFTFGIEPITDVPEIQNADGIKRKKKLYEAAAEGCWWKAKSILNIHKSAATEAITVNGNTILHIAVEMGYNYFLEKLLEFFKDGECIETRNVKGRTALHIAAEVGNKHAAKLLVQKRENLLGILDSNERSPFLISAANTKFNTSAYLLKCTPLDSLTLAEATQDYAICAAIFAKKYDLAKELLNKFPDRAPKFQDILMTITLTFPTDLSFTESFIYPSFNNVYQKTLVRGSLLFQYKFLDKCVDDVSKMVKSYNNTCCSWLGKNSLILLVPIATLYLIYHLICLLILGLRLPFSMLYFLMWEILVVTVRPFKNIEKKKREYKEAKKILSLVCNQMRTTIYGYRQSLFEAIRLDIYEVVDEILFMLPATMSCIDEKGHNVVQLTIINRSEKVYNLIHHIIERTESYRTIRDSSLNNLAHLAGRLAPSFVLGRTTGAALQLQREILWHEEVKKLMLPYELMRTNTSKETPAMVFTKEHNDLMKQGETWMKATAESCSITAALIVTVVFAAAITVPGGSSQESGIPVFKKEIAFTIFAISNAFSLFTASTSLLLFLSILTARFSEKDFLVSLPRRLIFGLLTLFLSTTAMILAFGAILFLVFCDQRPWMLPPIFGFACLPISVIVTIKLPLLVDLIQSTYFPIFGEHSYLESCKTNRKNTFFME